MYRIKIKEEYKTVINLASVRKRNNFFQKTNGAKYRIFDIQDQFNKFVDLGFNCPC